MRPDTRLAEENARLEAARILRRLLRCPLVRGRGELCVADELILGRSYVNQYAIARRERKAVRRLETDPPHLHLQQLRRLLAERLALGRALLREVEQIVSHSCCPRNTSLFQRAVQGLRGPAPRSGPMPAFAGVGSRQFSAAISGR